MADNPYRAIRAKFTENTITVYQAYSNEIADAAMRARTFVSPFKRGRMTWIKPSFLWVAYRSGWATKPDQERILAIEITRSGFEWALRNACLSHVDNSLYRDKSAWESRMQSSCVRVQWDPERDFYFNALSYRSIQIGLKGEAVDRYVDEWIVSITDVTEQIRKVSELVSSGELGGARKEMPEERLYGIPEDVGAMIGASSAVKKPTLHQT
ncbi:hypothetical protein MGYG_00842 [Nannizzia gypsea CBS 118893]|uniref:DUF4291 domain-containing protein n=1 Tax=Arthroderma gypseum (strain ATCC MYA-4604 / CBS 118893) TaxID=535722 RepID=E5R223_ARTGP|nr:hypothetical protein MGYG_00842 [Nannizzia gypsea CBS 118893]EFQ97802.1 hypothetical protein MGYG_00842 [Nannizzia gypsea CBS 118893]